VICTEKKICGNLLDLVRFVYAAPDHGTAALKQWIGQLLS
jgi:hypothetical protein